MTQESQFSHPAGITKGPYESSFSQETEKTYGEFMIQIDEILIKSQYDLACEKTWHEEYKEAPVIEKEINEMSIMSETFNSQNLYQAYRPTLLQLDIHNYTPGQQIHIYIDYANRLTNLQAKYAKICKYNEATSQWEALVTESLKKEKQLHAVTNESGTYGVFTNQYWHSTFTQTLANEFPRWTQIQQHAESIGQQFLNFFGIELEEIEEHLKWISEQKYINSIDIHVLDWITVYSLPDVHNKDVIQVLSNGNAIPVLSTLKAFFFQEDPKGVIIDYEQNLMFSIKSYDMLTLIINGEAYQLQGKPHQIWNALDEFGLLVNVKRKHLESNQHYRERILDVFRYPANTSKTGIIHGVARELDMIKHIEWKDDNKPLLLKNTSGIPLLIETLRIDGKPLTPDQYQVNNQHIYIHPLYENQSHDVTIVQSIYAYDLYDKENKDLYPMMFTERGKATSRLLHWVSYINTIAPVMWDHIRWDQGLWDTIHQNLTGLGYIPNQWDTSLKPWKSYWITSEGEVTQ